MLILLLKIVLFKQLVFVLDVKIQKNQLLILNLVHQIVVQIIVKFVLLLVVRNVNLDMLLVELVVFKKK